MIDISTGKPFTRRSALKGLAAIIAAGISPSVVSASTGGLRRGLGARLGMMGETLPYDAEVEYLQTNGYQSIQTNILFNDYYDFYCKWTRLSGNYGSWFVFDDVDNIFASDWVIATYPNGAEASLRQDAQPGTIYESYSSKDVCWIKKNSVVSATTTKTSTGLKSPQTCIKLSWQSTTRRASYRWYSFVVKLSEVNVLEFIPVRVGQVGYMYDRVSKQLFGNSGTGSFVLGPDKT